MAFVGRKSLSVPAYGALLIHSFRDCSPVTSHCPISASSLTTPAVARDFSCIYCSNRTHVCVGAQVCLCLWSLLSICVTLSCSALCVHQLGVAHQSSLRSAMTTMSFSISLSGGGTPNQSAGDFRTTTRFWHPRTGSTTLDVQNVCQPMQFEMPSLPGTA